MKIIISLLFVFLLNMDFIGSVGRGLVKNLISQKITMEVPYE